MKFVSVTLQILIAVAALYGFIYSAVIAITSSLSYYTNSLVYVNTVDEFFIRLVGGN